jgi:hypothetical protein
MSTEVRTNYSGYALPNHNRDSFIWALVSWPDYIAPANLSIEMAT